MKNAINIYSGEKVQFFLNKLLYDYKLYFFDLEQINNSYKNNTPSVVILNNEQELKIIDFKKLNYNHLILSSLKNLNFNKDYNLLITPRSINNIRSRIENFVVNVKIDFHDISIMNEKLTNLKNNSFCYLTKIELEILCFLIRERITTKDYIKENILNIKNNIETNSLESHLTRIRKKMNKINTSVKIQSKSEKLLITN